MLAATDPRVKSIAVMACTQLMKTELINNIVGYFCDQDPSPIIVMQPTEKLAKAWSVDRLDKMIKDSPRLKEKFAAKKSRDSTNTIQHKTFAGGHITIVGANAPADLAMRPARLLLMDEVDKYKISVGGATGEGDPILLLSERSATFWNALKVYVCSPTIEGRSRIQFEYEQSDKRRYQLKCPHCSVQLFPKWKQVKWEKNRPETAQYFCEDCGEAWTEPQRLRAIQKGSWKATAPFVNGRVGFHVSKLCSPWEPLPRLAEKFISAKKDPEKLQVFVNTQLAQTWKQKGEAPEWQVLYERREHYKIGTVPRGALFLTAGVDVQDKSLEIEIKGWGQDKQSWSVEKFVFHGDTSDERGPWSELDELLLNQWPTEDETSMPVCVMAVDSGFRTQTVYNWCRRYPLNRVIAVKGSAHAQMLLGHGSLVDIVKKKTSRSRRGFKVFTVGVDIAKSELYGLLRLPKPTSDDEPYPPGYCHFPEYDPEHFKQLTAEEIQKKIINGRSIYYWEKIRDRNEALDLHVYNRAAASFFGIDRFKPHH